jgi:predicted nucleotidyltransferase
MHRKVAFEVVVGSENYNLKFNSNLEGVESSDKDVKRLEYPTFDDLYLGKEFLKSKSSVSQELDVETHDVRKLSHLLKKSNINFIEMLYSVEATSYDSLYYTLIRIREEVARMNLPYLYEACMGMFHRKKGAFERDFNTPQAYKNGMTMYRLLDFLERYYKADFTDFASAMRYEDNDPMRHFLLSMRAGEYSSEQLSELVEDKRKSTEYLKEIYRSQSVNETTKLKIDEIVRTHVKRVLTSELVR